MKTSRIFSFQFIFHIVATLSLASLLTSCSNNVVDIPAGHVGKTLTSTGWSKNLLEAGQVDIGEVANDGTSTSLVLLETSMTTIKEMFMDAANNDSTEKGDHRVRTKDRSPLSVDIYVQIQIPDSDAIRNQIFAVMTPQPYKDRVSIITIQQIYEQFAKMTIRGNVRAIFAKYENADSVMANYNKINAEIALMVMQVVKDSHAPFKVVSAQLSNVKEDETVLESKNKVLAAQNEVMAIEMVGEAIRKNPYYLESRRLDVLEKIGSSGKSSTIIMDTKGNTTFAMPVNK